MKNRLHSLSVLIIFLAIAVIFSACSGRESEGDVSPEPTAQPQVLPDGTTINGIDVGGLTEQEVRDFFLDPDTAPTLGNIQIACGEDMFKLDCSSVVGVAQLDELLAAAFAQEETSFTIEYKYDIAPLKDLVAELAVQMNVAPMDATYAYDRNVEGRFVYTEGVRGRQVDAEALFDAIESYVAAGDFSQPCQAPYNEIEPAVTIEDVKRLTSVVSSATSSFAKGSQAAKNRVFNIEKALSMFDGYVLNPGEEFSFNTVLGPRYTSHGWKLAGAINNGKSVEEPGGGVCQVSSTTFNAVLMADLTIVERAPHSWPLSYLPAGQDATINTGTQDFIFRNDRETPIVIGTDIDTKKKELTITIYGEPLPDNQYIKLVSKRTGTIKQPPDEIVVVKTMKPGTSTVDRQGRSGSRYETYKEYYAADGTLIKSVLAYKTTYRAISTIIHKGPDVQPTDNVVDNEGVAPPPQDDAPQDSMDVYSDVPENEDTENE
ncbi:MAG: VanW family protein [Christensenellales bacterium]|jgi:vancomycin resistance protein YoaR